MKNKLIILSLLIIAVFTTSCTYNFKGKVYNDYNSYNNAVLKDKEEHIKEVMDSVKEFDEKLNGKIIVVVPGIGNYNSLPFSEWRKNFENLGYALEKSSIFEKVYIVFAPDDTNIISEERIKEYNADFVLSLGVIIHARENTRSEIRLNSLSTGESRVIKIITWKDDTIDTIITSLQDIHKNASRMLINDVKKEQKDNLLVEKSNTDTNKKANLPKKAVNIKSDVDVNIPKLAKKNKFGVALIIGNKNYKNQDISSVVYAHNDAIAVKEYVKNVLGYDEKNIIYLEDATQTDFITYLGSKDLTKEEANDSILATKVKDKSEVFIYYSGHGAPDVKDGNAKTAYFVPVDADPNRIKALGYPLNAFYDNLNKLKAKNITVVIDSCFSGGSEKGMLIKGASPIFIDVKGQYNFGKIDLFTSASGKQISSWYEDKNHSLFTYYFLKAMQLGNKADEEGEKPDVNGDGKLSLDEIYKYVNTKVKDVASSKNRIQTTEIYSTNKNKVLVSY